MAVRLPFDNSYARLPERFHARVRPTPVRAPRLIRLNTGLAEQLGLDAAALTGAAIFSGNILPDGADPIAMAYAGHQFGGLVPRLGDGRAILLGEVVDRTGVRRDIQLKGSGRTPFSRGGDGRAALGPVLREYIVSEAMHALGIPSTRALAAVTTGETVIRERPLPGAIVTRVASSHIRVGTFQYFAIRGDDEAVRMLADYVIERHYPHAVEQDQPYVALLEAVVARQADLIAQWLLVGFIHGVMNTDNMSIAGETIDFGPCAFMDEYHPQQVYSSIDQWGRYAYNNQPSIGEWNLARLAECLLPLIAEDQDTAIKHATTALQQFAPRFEDAYHEGLKRKIGLQTERDGDLDLVRDLLTAMVDNGADFTLTFRGLADVLERDVVDATEVANRSASGSDDEPQPGDAARNAPVRDLFVEPRAFDTWAARWKTRLQEEAGSAVERADAMRRVNPAFVPRNHRVEAVIRAAEDRGDFGPFETLLAVLAKPYEDQPEHAEYRLPPREDERVHRTFCGT